LQASNGTHPHSSKIKQRLESGKLLTGDVPVDVHGLTLIVDMGTLTSYIIIIQTIGLSDRFLGRDLCRRETTKLTELPSTLALSGLLMIRRRYDHEIFFGVIPWLLQQCHTW
jgi:hypothetical protein